MIVEIIPPRVFGFPRLILEGGFLIGGKLEGTEG